MQTFLNLIDEFAVYFSFFVAIVYVVFWFKLQNSKVFNVITAFMFSSAVITLIMTILSEQKIHNLFLSHFYFLLQFLLLSQFYLYVFKKKQKRFLNIFRVLFLVAILVSFIITPDLFFRFNNLEVFLTSSFLVVCAIVHLYNSLSEENSFIFINAGVLIYLSVSTLIFFLGNFLMYNVEGEITRDLALMIWDINSFAVIIYQLLLFLELTTNFSKWPRKTHS